jgi:hypothetical protein
MDDVVPMTRAPAAPLWLVALCLLAACAAPTEDAPPMDAAAAETSASADATATVAVATEPCNGHAALCDRRVDEVAFAGTHNSMASAEAGFIPPNHTFGLRRQLDDGIRAMLLDTHYHTDDSKPDVRTWLCHGFCELGKIPLHEGLRTLRDFLDERPREVLVLVFQDGIEPVDLAQAMTQSGLEPLIYAGPYGETWPTLGELVASNQRVIVTTESRGGPPVWHRRLWDLGWDTPYSFKGIEALEVDGGPDDSCRHNRGTTDGSLFLVNHWVSTAVGLPDAGAAEAANAHDFLLQRAQRCGALHGHIPNIVAVDQHHEGDVVGVVRALNGLP